jgi:hypothetical protein
VVIASMPRDGPFVAPKMVARRRPASNNLGWSTPLEPRYGPRTAGTWVPEPKYNSGIDRMCPVHGRFGGGFDPTCPLHGFQGRANLDMEIGSTRSLQRRVARMPMARLAGAGLCDPCTYSAQCLRLGLICENGKCVPRKACPHFWQRCYGQQSCQNNVCVGPVEKTC